MSGRLPAHPASIVTTTALAAVVVTSLTFNAAYYPTAAGLLGGAIVLAAAALLAVGARPSRPSMLTAGALVALGAWGVLSVAWGGVPHVAWRLAGLTVTGAAAVALGSTLGGRHRTAVWAGLLIGLAGHAAATLLVVALGWFPDEWFDGRQLEGTVGYHNAQGAAYAMGVPLALLVATSAHRASRFAGSAAAVVLIGAALLTQSRGTALAMALAAVVQTALARRARLVAIGLLLIPVTAVVLTQLTRVDEALVTASREGAAPDTRPLTGYAVAVGACALVLGLLATLRAPGALQRRDVRRAVVALGAAVAVAAVVVSVVAIASRADNLLERLRAEPNSVAQVSGGQTRLSSLSTTGRVDQWRLAGEMIGEEPLRGHGTGTFAARWAIERDDLNLYVLQPHSLELEVLVELGIVGGAALLLMLAGVGWLLVLGLRADRGVGAAATACVVAFVGFASVDWVFSFPLLLAVALLVVGSAGGPGQGRPVNLVLTVAVALAGLTVLAGPALGHWYLERSRAAETRSLAESGRLADRARTFNRWDPAIVSQQARVAEGVGSYETAARLYGRAAELAQQPWTDLYRQARALRSAGRGEASLAACRAAIRSNPLEPELRRGVCEEAD